MNALASSALAATGSIEPAACAAIGRAATLALYDELALAPKPGLVSFVDSGSHCDMDARTFMRSLFALRHAFPRFVALGAHDAPFAMLEQAGIAAEARMSGATGGVNTHRGAIFTLGLLCAAAGQVLRRRETMSAHGLRTALRAAWGPALAARAHRVSDRVSDRVSESHGARAARRFGLRSVGAEAADGFPVLFDTTLPALRSALRGGLSPARAHSNALFATMAVLDDTNLVHRGGIEGLRFAQRAARDYLAAGGSARVDGEQHAQALHAAFVARNLSPGGAADMLAAACWLHRVCVA
ncbi:MAG TPA: triphosphoribosyl-dephospho-CoA synthase MdcB [Burkholderiaceae bacterium]|nr:triphosphoribosyl-dephospho-CoA synthase MdcB [Burkholderiaceae bacterium]